MEKCNYLKKRLNSVSSNRGTWEDHWQEILDYVMPRKADVTITRTKGDQIKELYVNANAMKYNNLLATNMQGDLN